MKRKDFIRISASAFVLLANGKLLPASAMRTRKSKPVLRFVVGSDGHYGQKDTDYENFFSTFVKEVNKQHTASPFDFCVINGDIVHDEKSFLPDAKKQLDKLLPKYYVSQGNHDHVTATEWETIWKMPVNLDFSIGKNSFLVGTTSNEKGTYLCPDLVWLEAALEKHKGQQNIFLFIHINPGKLTRHAVDCPEFFSLLKKFKNLRAVFNGHDHDEDGIKQREGISFVFDAHIGGNWGTDYRGFRIVELNEDNSIYTYLLNPFTKINETTL